MDLLKWIGMIVGIFACLIIGIRMLMKSEEKRRMKDKEFKQAKQDMHELHKQLDETYAELQTLNEPLEKVSDFFKKINEQMSK